jgi:hypothetical protein
MDEGKQDRVQEIRDYVARNLPKIHKQMDVALEQALAQFSFLDANHGPLVLQAMVGYLKHRLPEIIFDDYEELTRGRFLAVVLTMIMTRTLFEGMIAELGEPQHKDDIIATTELVTKIKKKRPRTKFKKMKSEE